MARSLPGLDAQKRTRSMRLPRWTLPLLTAALLAGPAGPAMAAEEPIALSAQEAEAIKLKLAMAKPNVSSAAIISFLAPGTAQVYMNHVDRALLLWGGYLLGFTVIKAVIPPTSNAFPGGPKTSDVAVGSLFLGVAALSSLDAALTASKEREDYDRYINRLTDKTPLPANEITKP
jgi:hypothetical protein